MVQTLTLNGTCFSLKLLNVEMLIWSLSLFFNILNKFMQSILTVEVDITLF